MLMLASIWSASSRRVSDWVWSSSHEGCHSLSSMTVRTPLVVISFDAYFPGIGTRPSCCMVPSVSFSPQCSTILPFAMRKTDIPEIATFLPVAGTPTWEACILSPNRDRR